VTIIPLDKPVSGQEAVDSILKDATGRFNAVTAIFTDSEGKYVFRTTRGNPGGAIIDVERLKRLLLAEIE